MLLLPGGLPVSRPVGLELGRRPLRPAVLAAGVATGLAVAAVGILVGWSLGSLHPLAVDVALVEAGGEPPGWLLVVAMVLSYLGHALVIGPAALVLALLARRRWGTWDAGWLLLAVLGGATAVTGVIKLATDRTRPDEAMVATLSSAFPSGHAVRAVAMYGLLAWLVWRLARHAVLRWAAAGALAAVVALNAVARVVLGAHWPSDVLIGLVIGVAWLACALAILRPRPVTDRPPG